MIKMTRTRDHTHTWWTCFRWQHPSKATTMESNEDRYQANYKHIKKCRTITLRAIMNILSQKQMFLSHEFDFFRLLIPCIFLHFLNNQTNKMKPNQREKVT